MVRNDVPVIFSSMGQECGFGPGENVSNITTDGFVKHLGDVFKYVNSSFGALVADLYAPILANSTQLGFDTVAADTGMTCGNLELARAAGLHFKNPVYLVHNEQFYD